MTKTSLTEKLVHSKRDAGGTIAKNRLTFQISYGIQLIMEFFSTDSVLLMDYFEDIAVLNNPDNPDAIKLYQIKTNNASRPLSLTAVISDRWVQKLYENATQFGEHLEEGQLVCNDDIMNEKTTAFVNRKNCLKDLENAAIADKLKRAIANDLKIAEDAVDLSKFFVVRTYLSTLNHKSDVEHEFETFLQKSHEDIQVVMARIIYRNLYDILDNKFNREMSTKNTDLAEIIKNKGVKISEISEDIKDAVKMQVPQKDEIFRFFNITVLKERQKLATAYTNLKIDMHKKDKVFLQFKKRVCDCIENNSQYSQHVIIEMVYSELSIAKDTPLPYKEESYLRLLIMIMVMKYGE
jgi:hypothetical protein